MRKRILKKVIDSVDGYKLTIYNNNSINIQFNTNYKCFDNLSDYELEYIKDIFSKVTNKRLGEFLKITNHSYYNGFPSIKDSLYSEFFEFKYGLK